jgi:hypothetical protein
LDNTIQNILAKGLLTVVLPTHNHGHFIVEAIDSLYAQNRRPDRIIVLDDASTDDTASVVRQYFDRNPALQFVRKEENQGAVAMLNCGLALADTEYVTFLAADDFVRPDLYMKSLAMLDRHPEAAVCGVGTSLIDEDGAPLRSPQEPGLGEVQQYLPPAEAVKRLFCFGGLFGGNGAVYRVDKLRAADGFAIDLHSFCDGYVMQVLAARHGVCVIPEALAVWRQRGTGFATASRHDAEVCRTILKAVECRRTREGASFPPAYQTRLESRLRFAAAVAAACEPKLNERVLSILMPFASSFWFEALVVAKRVGGRPLVLAIMALWFRPFDILPAFWRRALNARAARWKPIGPTK